jgi:hypothetical protein
MKQFNYYQSQLDNLTDSEYNKNAILVLSDGQGNKTNNLCLNVESIPILISYLKKELKRLKKVKVLK